MAKHIYYNILKCKYFVCVPPEVLIYLCFVTGYYYYESFEAYLL